MPTYNVTRRRITEYVDNRYRFTAKEVATDLNLYQDQVRPYLEELVQKELLVKNKDGHTNTYERKVS